MHTTWVTGRVSLTVAALLDGVVGRGDVVAGGVHVRRRLKFPAVETG